MKSLLILAASLIFISSQAVAANFTVSGNVKAVYVSSSKTVLVKIENDVMSRCGNGKLDWPLTFTTDGAVAGEWLSMLLTSKTANISVTINYAENSTSACTMNYIHIE
ncbi:MAG: hypothetical protein RPU64_10850 [Candidatus Sedimenticola sp. (ex Thyasira tokunagai)]